MKYIYLVVGLAKPELNGREVALIAPASNPNLIFLRAEPRKI